MPVDVQLGHGGPGWDLAHPGRRPGHLVRRLLEAHQSRQRDLLLREFSPHVGQAAQDQEGDEDQGWGLDEPGGGADAACRGTAEKGHGDDGQGEKTPGKLGQAHQGQGLPQRRRDVQHQEYDDGRQHGEKGDQADGRAPQVLPGLLVEEGHQGKQAEQHRYGAKLETHIIVGAGQADAKPPPG